MYNRLYQVWVGLSLGLLLGLSAACTATPTPLPTAGPGTVAPPTLPGGTATALPPTASPTPSATPVPLAALVNGEPITLAAYEAEVARCVAGFTVSHQSTTTCPTAALESLIDEVLVAQAATQAGLSVSDTTLEAQLATITQELGGPEALNTWLTTMGYTRDSFRVALRHTLLRGQMEAQVRASIGPTAEQVHALALRVADEATATTLRAQLQNGADFSQLAVDYSQDLSTKPAGGDLGWFPRGVLPVPEVEAAAFALEPAAVSEVIATAEGYYLVQTLERDPAHPLSPQATQTLRAAAYQNWLAAQRAAATIERRVTP